MTKKLNIKDYDEIIYEYYKEIAETEGQNSKSTMADLVASETK